MPDIMHMLDCKSVTALVLGGALHYLLQDGRLGSNRGERLATLNGRLKRWYNANLGSNRLPPIRPGNLVADGWADLHGPTIKAANTRGAARLFRDIWRDYARPANDRDAAISELLNSLVALYDALYGGADVLSGQPDRPYPGCVSDLW